MTIDELLKKYPDLVPYRIQIETTIDYYCAEAYDEGYNEGFDEGVEQ